MKAISIRNPYAHEILCGIKEYEFGTWKTDYRGDLLICSSAKPKIENTISGHALCVVRLDDIIPITSKNYKKIGLDFKPQGKMYAWQFLETYILPLLYKGKTNKKEV